MAKSFTITTTATDTLKADSKGNAQAQFTVTNTTQRPLRGLASVKPLGNTERSWLEIAGETERDFGAGATEQFTVNFGPGKKATPEPATPSTASTAGGPGLPPGKYSFRFDVASALNPDEDVTEGPTVTVEVAPVASGGGGGGSKKWLIIVIAVVALLVIGGLLAWLLWPSKAETYVLPDVANASRDDAKQRLETECAKGSQCVTVAISDIADNAVAKDLAIRTEPAAGAEVPLGSNVTLFVSTGSGAEPPREKLKLPSVAGMTEDRAKQELDRICKTPPCVQLDVTRIPDNSAPAGTVIRTEPGEGTEVDIGSMVAIFVSRGAGTVTILNVANQTAEGARDMLEKSCVPAPCLVVELNHIADRLPVGRAIRTNPVAGTQVPTGSRVALFVSSGTTAPTPNTNAAALEAACFRAVQGRIAWNYQGSTTWAANNVQDLCRGTTNPTAPAACFQRVMHGGINWGGGTRWQWQNARDLCAGTNDANRTIACFQSRLRGAAWQEAIRACKSR